MIEMVTTKLRIPAITCAHCAEVIKKSLQALDEIDRVSVNVLQKTAILVHQKTLLEEKITQTLRSVGYPPQKNTTHSLSGHLSRLRLPLSLGLSLPFMIIMISRFFVPFSLPSWLPILEAITTGIIVFVFGYATVQITLRSFLTSSFGMESLIGIGSIIAFASGFLFLVGFPFENFFSIASMIMTIHFIGMHIRNTYTHSASNAVQKLLELGARTAQKLLADGSIQETSVEDVKPGDIVLVSPGSTIPVDGTITQGSTFVDESMITGEFLPSQKTVGDAVIGGSICQDGLIHIRTERSGADSFLARIIALVEQAQLSKVPIQALVDRVASIFVPVVISLSILSGLFWILFPNISSAIYVSVAEFVPWLSEHLDPLSQGISVFIATLVIACPCALGLATPTAISVSIGFAARQGILIKHAAAIQHAQDISIMGFDKTGTLTTGKPSLVEMTCIEDPQETLQIAASILKHSTHPLAQAIVVHAEQEQIQFIPINTHSVVPGYGINAEHASHTWYIGSIAYMQSQSIDTTNLPDASQQNGTSRVYIARDAKAIGLCYLHDAIHEDAPKTIAALHKTGIKSYIFSGDNPSAVAAVAQQLGIDSAVGGLLPHEKIDAVKKLQTLNTRVAMVGDGINDAPALKQADLSIAIGTGTDIAIDTADIVLVNKRLVYCQKIIALSKKTMSVIAQNLFWAFLFNVLAIPMAMTGILHPLIAEIAMTASSILVVLNALRLRPKARQIFDHP